MEKGAPVNYSVLCGRCRTCRSMRRAETIKGPNQEEYRLRAKYNCQSMGVVYCLECNKCGKKYVGETSTTFNTRFRNHDSTIKHNRPGPVAAHFNRRDHQGTGYRVTVLDKEWDKNKRLRLEEAWMHLLSTIQPYGMNLKL